MISSLHMLYIDATVVQSIFHLYSCDVSRPGVKRDEEGTTRRARASDERLCSESGARLDTQGWRQVVLSEVSTSEIQVRLTWRQEVETEVSR